MFSEGFEPTVAGGNSTCSENSDAHLVNCLTNSRERLVRKSLEFCEQFHANRKSSLVSGLLSSTLCEVPNRRSVVLVRPRWPQYRKDQPATPHRQQLPASWSDFQQLPERHTSLPPAAANQTLRSRMDRQNKQLQNTRRANPRRARIPSGRLYLSGPCRRACVKSHRKARRAFRRARA